MSIAPAEADAPAGAEKEFTRGGSRHWPAITIFLLLVTLLSTHPLDAARSQDLSGTQAPVKDRIQTIDR
jgi:hypothetical protein